MFLRFLLIIKSLKANSNNKKKKKIVISTPLHRCP